MASLDVDKYLARIGYPFEPRVDLDTLAALQRAHLSTVAFENLHVFRSLGVRTDTAWAVAKIVDQRRGGWCFENNGAFAALLEAIGFRVARLGAAVLLGGPAATIDHLTIEVAVDEPYLVDVGFGDSFIQPLRINQPGPQPGGTGTFEFINSSQGLTLTKHVDDGPVPQYRFRRVNLKPSDFDAASTHLQTDAGLHWSQKPFATRLLDGGPDRVTLLQDRLKLTIKGKTSETQVAASDWEQTLSEWFNMKLPT